MYQEIVDWNGDFGDVIETGSFNPFELLRQRPLTEFEREGACIAMLCYLMTAIENSTYESAVSDPQARQVRLVLRDALCEDVPLVKRALSAFLESEEAFNSANIALRSLPGVPELDIRKGEIIRLDIAYNHPVGDLIHAYIDYLSTQNYSRRKNKTYLHETVYFGANSVSLTFYDKFRECGFEEAKGLLRQEISFTNKTRIQKIFGARTLGKLSFPSIKRELEKALHILHVDLPILSGGRRAGIKLIQEFGLHEGVFLFGLLWLKEIFPLKILADTGNKHPRSLNRILARLPHRGYAVGMAVGEKDLPPLSIDVDILDGKRIAFMGNSNG